VVRREWLDPACASMQNQKDLFKNGKTKTMSAMEMPTICRLCKTMVEHDDMVINPMDNRELICVDCQREINEDIQMALGELTGND